MPTRLAITILGALAGLAIICGTVLTGLGHDGTALWPLATAALGAVAGILVPTSDQPAGIDLPAELDSIEDA